MKSIFESEFTLQYKDTYYEKQYRERKFRYLRRYNLILSLILLSLSITINIVIFILSDCGNVQGFRRLYATSISIATLIINLTTTLTCLFVKRNKLQEWVTYVNYILVLLEFHHLKYFFVHLLRLDAFYLVLLITVEMKFGYCWFFFGIVDFMTGLYLQVVSIVINISLFIAVTSVKNYPQISISACVLLMNTVIVYFYMKEVKTSFYYNMSLKLQNEWYKSVINNMNSGFVSIYAGGVQCNNKAMGYLKSSDRVIQGPISTQMNCNEGININSRIHIDELFEDIQCEGNRYDSFDSIEKMLRERYSESESNFIFIGNKDIEFSPSCVTYLEVFGRCYSSDHKTIDRYEFIFNDLTKTKQIEQRNAEFKYKSLFLSKVAHEFKNPLLCISELVDQVNELLPHHERVSDAILDTLKRVKSMSNYLVLLIKDLDFFSRKSAGVIEHKIEPERVNLDEMITFCKDIVTSLIKKVHKEYNVEFKVLKDNGVPKYITTDEIKLKQIIINLLSNSVKYTQHGQIVFKIISDGQVVFRVDDTGRGISENQKETLFVPFKSEYDKLNKISSGLGMSIVKELVEMLGSHIEYESTLTKGSSFWFSLPYDREEPLLNNSGDITLIGDYFNDIPISRRLSAGSAPEADLTVLVVDDEVTTRQATNRLVCRYLKDKKIHANIIQASDGIECLNLYYTYITQGKKIGFILTDETMVYMNGSASVQILNNIEKSKNMAHIPIFILTAYENLSLGVVEGLVDGVFTKPLCKQNIDEIIKRLDF
jgi:signal transduction histidine kinase